MDPYFAGAERELATLIGQRMAAETKEDQPADPGDRAGQGGEGQEDPGPGLADDEPGGGRQEVGADYVIDLTLNSMSIYQPEYGREFFQGRAQLQVVV